MSNINVVWWNLQNFFDTDDDPISRDFKYTAEYGWTEDVFTAKKKNLAAALNATHDGSGIDLLVVGEIEKDDLLAELVAEIPGSNLEVIRDPGGTSDYRGIDVAAAFNPDKLVLQDVISHVVHLRYRTRDILELVFNVRDTGEPMVVIGSHWPSRRIGKYKSEPSRVAVAENIAYLVESHLKVSSAEYEELRAQHDLQAIREKWDTKIMIVGDFNDEPFDRSVVDHLKASSEIDRVIGRTNDIDRFKSQVADYRSEDIFLYNTCWKFLEPENLGSYFMSSTMAGEQFANRYQVLDQLIVSRGLLLNSGLTLDRESVSLFRDKLVATSSGRPRAFHKKRKTGTSDHLPLTAVLTS